ncbi:MAG: hypothetical protein ACI4B5_05810 [Bacteroidaceae bacterium]
MGYNSKVPQPEQRDKWLLTAFEKKNSAPNNTTDTVGTKENGKRNDTTTPQNTVSQDKVTNTSDNNQGEAEKISESLPANDVQSAIAVAESETNTEPTDAQSELDYWGEVKAEHTAPPVEETDADVEVDENGKPFVVSPNGTTTFGEITDDTGLPAAPIKLSEGFQDEDGKGYGLAHIETNHGEQIRNSGFTSVEEFVAFVAQNYDKSNIRVGKRRDNGSTTYLLQAQDDHDNTLFIEMSRDGSYWNVNSAGVFRKGYSNKKETAAKTEPQQPNNAVSDGSSLSADDNSGISATEPNGEPTVSAGKVTNTSDNNQGEAEKISESLPANDVQSAIAVAESETNTEPTEAQKEAGNYKKGHFKIDGFDVSIEQPKGSVRRGTDASGRKWEQTMNNTYGYIRGTEGVDGDHIDVFFSDDPSLGDVFVIDQVNKDGTFDEHKVMYGFPDELSAREAYLSNYEDGWQGLGSITHVGRDEFKKWVESSHRKTKPFAEYKSVKESAASSSPKSYDVRPVPSERKKEDEGVRQQTKESEVSTDDIDETTHDNGEESQQESPIEKSTREDNDAYDKLLENQGEISGKERPKYRLIDFAAKGKENVTNRPALTGIYHDGGFAVSTDGYVLVADKRGYDKNNEGNILDKEGNKIEAIYPKWANILPSQIRPTSIDPLNMLQFLSGVKAKAKERGIKYADCMVYLNLGGEIRAYKAYRLEKFCNAAKDLGAKVFKSIGEENSYIRLYAEGKNGCAIVMPYTLYEGFESLPESFAYKPVTLGEPVEAKIPKKLESKGKRNPYRLQKSILEADSITDEEEALRDALTDVLTGSGIEVITDAEEGQRVLDAANGGAKLMGSRVSKRMTEISDFYADRELSEQEKTVIDVFTGKKDRSSFKVDRTDGRMVIEMQQGNENHSGSKHSIFRHFNTRVGFYTAQEIAFIPDIISNGERKEEGKSVIYSKTIDGVQYKVITDKKGNKEVFKDFYTNRKAATSESSNTPSGARTSEVTANRDAKLQEKSDTSKSDDVKFQKSVPSEEDIRRKEVQLDIINSNNPAPDDYHTWVRSTDDILTLQEAVDEVLSEDPDYELSAYPDVSDEMIRSALETGRITVYSSYPIGNGVFVTPSMMQAIDYAGGNRVYSKEVSIKDVAWLTTDEGQYASDGKDAAAESTDVRFFRTPVGDAYGFTIGGKIYIDPRRVNAETPIHEYTHLWASALRERNPKEWENIVSLMKDTPVWDEVRKAYPELETDDEIADEVLAQYSGKRGAERLRAEQERIMEQNGDLFGKAAAIKAISNVRSALDSFWKRVARMLGIPYVSAEDVADSVLRDMLNGVKPETSSEAGGIRYESNSEEAEIVARAKDGGTYMKAPNGKKSNLTPRQWVQVRTKAFKDWFGDWEKSVRSKRIQGLSAIGINPHSMSKEELQEVYKSLKPIQKDGHTITFYNSAFKKIYKEDGLFAKIVPQLRDVFKQSLFAYDEKDNLGGTKRKDETIHKEHKNIVRYLNYVGKVNILGKDYYVRFTVQEEVSGMVGTHSFFVSNVDIYENPTESRTIPITSRGTTDFDGIVDAKLQQFFDDAKNSSKIVDENGEPLVVTHVTDNTFTVFDIDKAGENTDFNASDENYAKTAHLGFWSNDKITSDKAFSSREMKLFLNIRSPYTSKSLNDLASDLEGMSAEDMVENLKDRDYDGIMLPDEEFGGTSYVAFDPSQIKSATDNVGTFDGRNPDIRYQFVGERGAATMDKSEEASVRLDNLAVAREMDRSGKDATVEAADNLANAEEDDVLYRSDEAIEASNEQFNEELQRYLDGDMNPNDMLHLGTPLGAMQSFLPKLPIVIRQRILSKAAEKKHDVDISSLQNMPRHLAEPIFIFQRDENTIGVLTEIKDKNDRNVCVAIEMNKTIQNGGDFLEVNDIRSIHGRRVENIIFPIIQNGTLWWVDKTKGLNWLSSASPNVQQEIDKKDLDSAAKIVKDFENPKFPDENSSSDTDFERQGEGEYTDSDISQANDPVSKMTGENPNFPLSTDSGSAMGQSR